jgi:hypothetical protein
MDETSPEPGGKCESPPGLRGDEGRLPGARAGLFPLPHRGRLAACRVTRLSSLVAVVAIAGCGGDGRATPSAPSPPAIALTAPTAVSPADNAELPTLAPELVVTNSVSTVSGTREYQFQVADESSFASGLPALALVVAGKTVPEGSDGMTKYQVEQDLQPGRRYYWRARATQGTATSDWSASSRFVTRSVVNLPPAITSLVASSPRVEVGQDVGLTAVVTDSETPVDQLVFEWSAASGAFTGTGPSVRWRAPSGLKTSPETVNLLLTVIERYQATDPDGNLESRENRAAGAASITVTDSVVEITNLVTTFLDDFSNSSVPAATCVRNFSDNCRGKQEELQDIEYNRATRRIESSSYRIDRITINPERTYADIKAVCTFRSVIIASGQNETAIGDCLLTAVYEGSRWLLCDSFFRGTTTTGLLFAR